jgi:hypothetical protein
MVVDLVIDRSMLGESQREVKSNHTQSHLKFRCQATSRDDSLEPDGIAVARQEHMPECPIRYGTEYIPAPKLFHCIRHVNEGIQARV